jgi:hypothetical protein
MSKVLKARVVSAGTCRCREHCSGRFVNTHVRIQDHYIRHVHGSEGALVSSGCKVSFRSKPHLTMPRSHAQHRCSSSWPTSFSCTAVAMASYLSLCMTWCVDLAPVYAESELAHLCRGKVVGSD